ncbi:MAG: hypothetical protein JXQ30_14815 [Spirochaetes bacterium]|nr:hypothetical protein [Spirochaetota bacterium]
MRIKIIPVILWGLALLLPGCLSDQGTNGFIENGIPSVYLDTYNRLIVHGEPFFPIGLYWVPTSR